MKRALIPEMDINASLLAASVKANDLAVITIGKTSGEFADRNISDNFNLTDVENKMISDVCRAFHKAGKKVVVIKSLT